MSILLWINTAYCSYINCPFQAGFATYHWVANSSYALVKRSWIDFYFPAWGCGYRDPCSQISLHHSWYWHRDNLGPYFCRYGHNCRLRKPRTDFRIQVWSQTQNVVMLHNSPNSVKQRFWPYHESGLIKTHLTLHCRNLFSHLQSTHNFWNVQNGGQLKAYLARPVATYNLYTCEL